MILINKSIFFGLLKILLIKMKIFLVMVISGMNGYYGVEKGCLISLLCWRMKILKKVRV